MAAPTWFIQIFTAMTGAHCAPLHSQFSILNFSVLSKGARKAPHIVGGDAHIAPCLHVDQSG